MRCRRMGGSVKNGGPSGRPAPTRSLPPNRRFCNRTAGRGRPALRSDLVVSAAEYTLRHRKTEQATVLELLHTEFEILFAQSGQMLAHRKKKIERPNRVFPGRKRDKSKKIVSVLFVLRNFLFHLKQKRKKRNILPCNLNGNVLKYVYTRRNFYFVKAAEK